MLKTKTIQNLIVKKKRCNWTAERWSQWNVYWFETTGSSGSWFFCNNARSTRRPQLTQGCAGETSWFSEDFLGKAGNTGIMWLKKENQKRYLSQSISPPVKLHFQWQAVTGDLSFCPTCMNVWHSSTNGPWVICLKFWQTSGSDWACWIRASLWWISVRATRNRILEPS